jgi:hypothetical protein
MDHHNEDLGPQATRDERWEADCCSDPQATEVAITLIAVPIVQAITFGQLDGDGHPNMKAMIVEDRVEYSRLRNEKTKGPAAMGSAG